MGQKFPSEGKNDSETVPSDEEILRVLAIGQNLYIEKQHEPRSCYNFDETAITYANGSEEGVLPKRPKSCNSPWSVRFKSTYHCHDSC